MTRIQNRLCALLTVVSSTSAVAGPAPVPESGSLRIGPPPAIAWAAREPITLLDWGMYRADQSMKKVARYFSDTKGWQYVIYPRPEEKALKFFEHTHYQLGWAGFNAKTNEITLGSVITVDDPKTITADMCIAMLRAVRAEIFLNTGAGSYNKDWVEKSAERMVSWWFTHWDWKDPQQPENFYREIEKLIRVEVRMSQSVDPTAPMLRCSLPLIGEEVSVTNAPLEPRDY